ncbi:hypothetical protein PILCRDRAFT_517018 [Piloderma croceum F 1598]|uniref:Uncharacterized protein n=1 Tax=Piloderma croceum (strain F 1598) TaxID=765440 RepID=A0A0C3FM01_PILCF|nr:hypothetical protein PILCRDRAFT_517018 [Piloderma croceum F 1598]
MLSLSPRNPRLSATLWKYLHSRDSSIAPKSRLSCIEEPRGELVARGRNFSLTRGLWNGSTSSSIGDTEFISADGMISIVPFAIRPGGCAIPGVVLMRF